MSGWDAVQEGGQYSNKLEYIKLEVGDNRVRFLDAAPTTRIQVWVRGDRGNFPVNLPVGVSIPDDVRKLIKDDDIQKRHFIRVVKTAKDGTVHAGFLSGGDTLFNSLKTYATNPEYGDIRSYGWNLNRVGTDRNNTRYTPIPDRANSPMNAAEKEAANKLFEAVGEDLEKAVEVKTIEDLRAALSGGSTESSSPSGGSDSSAGRGSKSTEAFTGGGGKPAGTSASVEGGKKSFF